MREGWDFQSRFLAQMFDNGFPHLFLSIEKIEMNEEALKDLLYKRNKKSIKTMADNPFIIYSVQIKYKLHELFKQVWIPLPSNPFIEK